MKAYEIKGHKVTFDEATHKYTVDGYEVPSVSTILKDTIFNKKYSSVKCSTTNAAALWGTQIHVAIENKNPMLLDTVQEQRYNEFWQLLKSIDQEIHNQEQIVFYKHNGKVVYVGTYDLLLGDTLADIKCTYNLDMNYLSWQLNLYRMAYEQLHDTTIKSLYAFWLPKRKKGKVAEVEMKEDKELLEFVESL